MIVRSFTPEEKRDKLHMRLLEFILRLAAALTTDFWLED